MDITRVPQASRTRVVSMLAGLAVAVLIVQHSAARKAAERRAR